MGPATRWMDKPLHRSVSVAFGVRDAPASPPVAADSVVLGRRAAATANECDSVRTHLLREGWRERGNGGRRNREGKGTGETVGDEGALESELLWVCPTFVGPSRLPSFPPIFSHMTRYLFICLFVLLILKNLIIFWHFLRFFFFFFTVNLYIKTIIHTLVIVSSPTFSHTRSLCSSIFRYDKPENAECLLVKPPQLMTLLSSRFIQNYVLVVTCSSRSSSGTSNSGKEKKS